MTLGRLTISWRGWRSWHLYFFVGTVRHIAAIGPVGIYWSLLRRRDGEWW